MTRRGKDNGQKEDNRRARKGQEEAEEVKNRRKGGQQEDKKRTGSGQKETAKGQGLEVG